ncbi:histidine kinase [Streptomyces sp. NBC_00663]|uniref:sensor histidine kinase n=1 Tax=Streptomyces sp. NBC_00663 TaxID=2975801 RepID=UPI002E2F657E|nr:histidine kinase [Streptomyces sp. NBC_00663]
MTVSPALPGDRLPRPELPRQALGVGVFLLAGVDLVRYMATPERVHLEELHQLAAAVGAVLALLLRGHRPVLVLFLTLPGMALSGMVFATMISLFHVALRRRWQIVAGCVAAASTVGLADTLLTSDALPDHPGAWLSLLVYTCALAAAPAALGAQQRTRRALAADLRTLRQRRAEELRTAQRLAVSQERTVLARELHDSVGHAASLIALRAAALRARTDEANTARDAAAIHALSRQALDEMRTLTGSLRADARPAAPLGIQELPQLIERAGHDGESRIDLAAAARWPAEAQSAAYRVVQEALTNCARYAPGARVKVTVASVDQDSHLVIEVHNGPSAQPPAPPRPGSAGLDGLRARLAALGGELTARPTSEAGYLVRAAIPARARPSGNPVADQRSGR